MAKGLGVKQLLARFMRFYSDNNNLDENGKKRLFFILNAHLEEDLLLDYLLHTGVRNLNFSLKLALFIFYQKFIHVNLKISKLYMRRLILMVFQLLSTMRL